MPLPRACSPALKLKRRCTNPEHTKQRLSLFLLKLINHSAWKQKVNAYKDPDLSCIYTAHAHTQTLGAVYEQEQGQMKGEEMETMKNQPSGACQKQQRFPYCRKTQSARE